MNEPARGSELDDPLEPETIFAVFSATARRGEWLPAEDTRVRACFGSVVLDFTQALLAPGVTVLETLALFGSIEILVPADLEVELAASAVLGSVEQRDAGGRVRRFLADQIRRVTGQGSALEDPRDSDAEAPLLRIEGHAVFGSIVVKVR
ncbi:MAG TPA: LiaF domain-containing protein [Myxococcota bacterium]|nr:LiaF domain-containing protein [Myxococcota bacterium]